jgi:hypothetical protein
MKASGNDEIRTRDRAADFVGKASTTLADLFTPRVFLLQYGHRIDRDRRRRRQRCMAGAYRRIFAGLVLFLLPVSVLGYRCLLNAPATKPAPNC